MNPRNTLILAVVVAALGVFLYFYEIRGQQERAEAAEAAKRLFQEISAEQIDAVALASVGQEPVRLERRGARWSITEPVRFPADEIRADSLASTLASLSSEAVFDEPEPLDEYGIGGDPSVRFWIGDVEHRLFIGDKTPIGGNTYMKTGAGAQVYAVQSYHANALNKSLEDLRDARVLDFDRDSVSRIEARWPGGSVTLEKDEAGWQMRAPLEGAADPETVDRLLSDLKYLRADGFIDEMPPESETGLDAPVFDVELVSRADAEDAEPAHSRMTIGARLEDGKRAVRGVAEQALYRLAADRLEDFPRSVAAYRFKQLGEFESADAERFELIFSAAEESGPYVIRGERGEEGWATAPESMAAGKASRLVTELSRLRAVDIAADSMGAEELRGMGLSPPAVTLRVFAAADEAGEAAVLADVQLGKADPKRGIAAQRAGDPVVYWLDFELAEHVPVSREAFTNRFVTSEEPPQADEMAPAAEEAETATPE